MKKLFSSFFILILFCLFFSTGAFAAKKDGLNEAMMGENLSGGIGDYAIQARNKFTADNNEVLWFASFKGFMGAPNAKLKAEWVTPAGEIFKEGDFSTKYGNARFGWAKLDIQGVDKKALELEGDWTVKVYWDDELIDTRTFHIGEKEYQKIAPSEILTFEGSMRLSKVYYAKGDMNKAIEQLRIAESLDPTSKEAYLLLGTVYNAVGKSEDAIKQFSKAQDLKADKIAVHSGLADAYANLGLMEEAIKEREAILVLNPNSADEIKKIEDLKTNNAKKTTPEAGNPNKLEPKNFVYIGEHKIPIVAESNNNYILKLNDQFFTAGNKSLTQSQSASEAEKAAADCSAAKAQDYLFGVNRRPAFEIYEKCAEKHPSIAEINRAAGLLAMALDEREKCLTYFSNVSRILPEDPLALEQYGDALMLNLRNDEAKAQYEKSIEIGHHDASRVKIKITKLTPKKDITYIKQYLLAYTGMAIEDSLPAYVLYPDSKHRPSKNNYIYKQQGQTGKIGLVDLNKIRKEFSQWKKLDEYENLKRKEYVEKRKELEKVLKKDDTNALLKTELIRLIVETESVMIVSKSNYEKKMDESLKRVSTDFSKTNGYRAVAKTGGELQGEDVTEDLLKKLEEEKSLSIIPENLFSETQKEIKLREDNLQPERFFSRL